MRRDSVHTAEAVRRHFPNVKIYARARDRNHAYQLIDVGVTVVNRETWIQRSLNSPRNGLP